MKNNLFIISLLILLFGSISLAQETKPIIKTFPTSDGEILELKVEPGNVEIYTWNKNEVKIETISKKKYQVDELIANKTGTIIKFYLKLNDDWNNNITVKIYAPSRFNFDLKTTGGNISVNENIIGWLKADSEGGNISFENIVGDVLVRTSGGNISGEDVNGKTQLQTKGGNISIGDVKGGKSQLNTYGGNISVGNVASDLSAKTHGGNLGIGSVGGNANVFTYGGHISMEKVSGSAKMETYGGHINLDGASGKVVAKTSGGHINLEDITGSIEASTKGGHVNAELDPNPNSVSTLETSGGHMGLKIPGTAKATIEVFVENDDIEDEDPNEILKSDFPSAKFDVDNSSGEIKATYVLNGGGAKISLNCTGGKVNIEKWNK